MQYCLTIQLKDNPELIKEYEKYHQAGQVWPEVIKSIRDSGILNMSIYRLNTQLIMIIDVDKTFDFNAKVRDDLNNPKVQEWEMLMEKYQLIDNKNKWKVINRIFSLAEQK